MLTLALAGLTAPPAQAATGSLTASRSAGIPGESLRFDGTTGSPFARDVVLQRYASGSWVAVKAARTTSSGGFSILSSVRGSDTTYRVTATKVKHNATWFAARSTPNRRVLTQAQAAAFVSVSDTVVGASATVKWKFHPPRTDRPTILQRWTGTAWSTLSRGEESSDGFTTFSWTPASSGTKTFRAVALVHNGAVQHASASHSFEVGAKRRLPAGVLDLTNWKLTLPVGSEDDPDEAIEIKQPALAEFEEAPYFHVNSAGTGVVFRAHAGGATTSGSSYPRSELREMKNGGKDNASWSSASGTHILTVREAITAVPSVKPHVVAAQIHDKEDDVLMVRLENKRLFVEADGDEVGLLDAAYVLGTPFTIELRATSAGIRVSYNGTHKVTYDKAGSGWYFKAGCYTQSNEDRGDDADAYGEVVISDLSVEHS